MANRIKHNKTFYAQSKQWWNGKKETKETASEHYIPVTAELFLFPIYFCFLFNVIG